MMRVVQYNQQILTEPTFSHDMSDTESLFLFAEADLATFQEQEHTSTASLLGIPMNTNLTLWSSFCLSFCTIPHSHLILSPVSLHLPPSYVYALLDLAVVVCITV